MAGTLDSARMSAFIAKTSGVGFGQVQATVLGGHGDDMVPLPRFSTINGVPMTELLSASQIQEIIEKTRKGGAQIVGLLGTSAYYAPAQSTVSLVKAIIQDTHAVLPCAVVLEGEYGEQNVVNGVPVVLGKNGIEQIIQLPLRPDEQHAFKQSVQSVRALLETLETHKFFA